MHQAAPHLLGTVLNAICAVAVLQVTGCSVGVENAQIFWTIDTCVWGLDSSIYTGATQMLLINNFCSCDLRSAENRTTERAQFKAARGC